MSKEQGWKYQERVDAEMAADLSRDRNMLDHVMYNNNGVAFITLAGIMAIANEEEFDSEIVDIDMNTQTRVNVVVKVTTKEGRSMFSGRTEYTHDDQFALTKAINIATKNAAKQLLYGHPRVNEMITEFVENNEWTPPPPPKTESQDQAKSEPKKGNMSLRDQALAAYNAAVPTLTEISVHEEKQPSETFQDWLLYTFVANSETLTDDQYKRIISELKSEGMGIIGKFYSDPPEDMEKCLAQHAKMLAEKQKKKEG